MSWRTIIELKFSCKSCGSPIECTIAAEGDAYHIVRSWLASTLIPCPNCPNTIQDVTFDNQGKIMDVSLVEIKRVEHN